MRVNLEDLESTGGGYGLMKVCLADLYSKGWGKRMVRVSLVYLESTGGLCTGESQSGGSGF